MYEIIYSNIMKNHLNFTNRSKTFNWSIFQLL